MTEDIKNEKITAPESSDPAAINESPSQPEVKERRVGWFDVVVVMALFFISQMVGASIALAFGVRPPGEAYVNSFDADVLELADAMQSRFVAITFLIAMLLCFFSIAIYRWLRRWPRILQLHTPSWSMPMRLLGGYVLMWTVSIVVEPIASLLPGNQDDLGGGGWLLFSAVLLAPIFEETIFRGYVSGILRYLYGGVAAWLLSALIFGAAHLIPSVMLTATACGLVLGFYYLRFRSLMTVIILHAMNNMTVCFFRAIDMGDVTLREVVGSDVAYWGVYLVSLLATVVAFSRMARVMARVKSEKSTPKV